MLEGSLLPQSNPERESSPEAFLSLFGEISGMVNVSGLDNKPKMIKPRSALLGGVVGAVVIGSCSRAGATPKDLDVVFALDRLSNPIVLEYCQELGLAFDGEVSRKRQKTVMGALDIAPWFVVPGQMLEEYLVDIFKHIEQEIVFAYDLAEIQPTIELIRKIKGEM